MRQAKRMRRLANATSCDYCIIGFRASLVRSIVKGTTYRALGSSITFFIGWYITGSLPQATAISFLEIFSKILGFAIHDRIWQYINLGKK